MPSFNCRLPGVARWAPHWKTRWSTTLLSPHRVHLPWCNGMIGSKIAWERHHRFVRIVAPLCWIPRVWPPSFLCLGQNVSSMHSVFLHKITLFDWLYGSMIVLFLNKCVWNERLKPTWRWLATLCLVKPSTFINSKIREGMAWSTPSCSTAWTNFLCRSGVQSTWMNTQFSHWMQKCTQKSKLQRLNNQCQLRFFNLHSSYSTCVRYLTIWHAYGYVGIHLRLKHASKNGTY